MNKLIKKLKIHIYADGANLKEIKDFNKLKFIKGFTTNPSLMKNNNVDNYKSFAKKVLGIVKNKSVSFEIFADDYSEILKQAMEIKSWGKNVFVKIPFYNSKGSSNIKLIKILSKNGVNLNITALFNFNQVKDVFKNIDKNSQSILSIFAGRIADTGINPSIIIKKSVALTKRTKKIKILWASCREIHSIFQADDVGCHIITVPDSILKKINIVGKNLNDYSKETSRQFFEDSKGIKFN
jgi:transaldolase